jgi:hypothetical protein
LASQYYRIFDSETKALPRFTPREDPDRYRSWAHRRFVSSLRCIRCGRDPPSDPHHLKFVQPRGMAIKSGDQWCVPMCRRCHDLVEDAGDERAWWHRQDIDPVPLAIELWEMTCSRR